jgi:hypothetical protein
MYADDPRGAAIAWRDRMRAAVRGLDEERAGRRATAAELGARG